MKEDVSGCFFSEHSVHCINDNVVTPRSAFIAMLGM